MSPPDGKKPDEGGELVIGPQPVKMPDPQAVPAPILPGAEPIPAEPPPPAAPPAAPPPAPAPAAPAGTSNVAALAPLPKGELASAKGAATLEPRIKLDREQLMALGVAVLAFLFPLYFALTSHGFRDAGIGAFAGLFFGLLALFGANLRLYLSRKDPHSLGLAAAATAFGAAGILVAGIFAHRLHADAALIAASNEAHEYGMREHLVGEAQHSGRVAALIGLISVPGFLIGALNLALILGARRIAITGARLKGKTVEMSEVPVWVALGGASALFLGGLVTDVWAVFRSVDRRPNPREEKLEEIRDAVDRGDLKVACEGLEKALVPDYVPKHLLDEKLPARVEIAHRCIARDVDDLPMGKACGPAADKLLDKEIGKVPGAKDRIKNACKGR